VLGEGDKLVLPKWLLPALGTAGITAATTLFNMHTDVELLKQSDKVKDRMIYELRDEITVMKRGQEEFHNAAIDKLDHLGRVMEKRK
jgi:hypothetical protein